MKVELEEINTVQKKLKIAVPADAVAEARGRALSAVQKKAKAPGFREGKVPTHMVQQMFAQEIQAELVEQVVDITLIEAFKKADVYPISRPKIEPGLWGGDGGFTYTAAFEVLPKLKLKDYNGLKLEKEEVAVESAEVDAELKQLQDAMTQLEPLPEDTVLAEGHVARIDFKGTADGAPFPGNEGKDYVLEIGTGEGLAAFESGIKGAKAGESRQVSFAYPDDYFNKELAGKKADFSVTVKELRRKVVPVLNDDFAKDIGDYKDLAAVKEEVLRRLTLAKEETQKTALFNQILDQLVANNSFEVPNTLVMSELNHMLETYAKELQKHNQKLENVDLNEVVKRFQPEAEGRVRRFLILDEIANLEKMTVTDAELETRLEESAKAMNRPAAEIKAYYEKNNLLGTLKTRILHEKALEFVLNAAKIKSVKPKKEKK